MRTVHGLLSTALEAHQRLSHNKTGASLPHRLAHRHRQPIPLLRPAHAHPAVPHHLLCQPPPPDGCPSSLSSKGQSCTSTGDFGSSGCQEYFDDCLGCSRSLRTVGTSCISKKDFASSSCSAYFDKCRGCTSSLRTSCGPGASAGSCTQREAYAGRCEGAVLSPSPLPPAPMPPTPALSPSTPPPKPPVPAHPAL